MLSDVGCLGITIDFDVVLRQPGSQNDEILNTKARIYRKIFGYSQRVF
jgi:hypothetical protein